MSTLSNKKITDSFVIDAMASITDVAHIKDAKTKQYISCNASTLQCFGLEKPEQIAGLTAKDLDGFMRPYWGDEYANKIDQMDYLVCTKLETISHKEVTTVKSGFMQLQNLIKMPVINNNKASGIFTITQNLTDTLDLGALYDLYKNHYSSNDAVSYFLKYLELDTYFTEMPTSLELSKLISTSLNNNIESSGANDFTFLVSKLKNEDLTPILSEFERHAHTHGSE
jgi:hypothetical protein